MKTQDYLTRGCIDWQPLTPVDCVDKWSSLRPDSTALLDLVDGEVGIEVSWRALRQRVDALARRLKFAGLQLGDHVAIWMPNGMRWIEALLAVHAAGGVDVPLDIRLRREQCLAFARTTHCRWIVRQVGRQVVWQRIELGPSRSSSQQIQIEDACSNNHCLDDRFEVAYDVIASADDPEKYGVPAADGLTDDAEEMDCFVQVATLDPRRLASIQWTSGTTGAPKGVMLSHYNLLSNACGKWLAVPQQPTDVRITVLSLAHAYARTSDLGTWLVSAAL